VQGLTALSLASTTGKHRVVSRLLDAGAKHDVPGLDARAALHHAAMGGHLECARRLLKAGAFVDQPSALTNGAGPGHTPLLVAAYGGHYKLVKLLLRAKASVNLRAKDGATALVAAASAGHKRVVKALLRAGANVRIPLESGETAIHVTRDRTVSRLLYIAEYEQRVRDAEAASGGGASSEASEARSSEGSEGADEYVDLDAGNLEDAEDDVDEAEGLDGLPEELLGLPEGAPGRESAGEL